MSDDEDLLAGIDLHSWRVPPPGAVDRSSLLVRALSPATSPKRSRITWLVAAFALINIALASIIVILLSRPSPTHTVTVLPAGGSDAQIRELLDRLEAEQHELETKLAETKELRAVVSDLSEKVRNCEQRTVQKQHPPTPIAPAPVTPPPIAPTVDSDACDEVSCVLMNYSNGCCEKYKKPPVVAPPKGTPESLTRTMISNGISGVKANVSGCVTSSTAKGIVKVRVQVAGTGRVTNVVVEKAPDVVLARCVASAVQRATFERTVSGGSFSYPFVF